MRSPLLIATSRLQHRKWVTDGRGAFGRKPLTCCSHGYKALLEFWAMGSGVSCTWNRREVTKQSATGKWIFGLIRFIFPT